MFFESNHSILSDEFRISTSKNIDFPPHIHRSFELIYQMFGSTEVTIDGKMNLIEKGQAALIFPYQSHSYKSREHGKLSLAIFSPELVPDFYAKTKNLIPNKNTFSFDLDFRTDSIYFIRSFLYRICGEFDSQNTFVEEKKDRNSDLLTDLLLFAEKNFKSECSLKKASSELGYDYAYLSKYFKKKIGIPFIKYVNMLRIRESREIMKVSDKPIIEIAEECGFNCLRTYDREFISVVGSSPTEYRKIIHHLK